MMDRDFYTSHTAADTSFQLFSTTAKKYNHLLSLSLSFLRKVLILYIINIVVLYCVVLHVYIYYFFSADFLFCFFFDFDFARFHLFTLSRCRKYSCFHRLRIPSHDLLRTYFFCTQLCFLQSITITLRLCSTTTCCSSTTTY